MSESIAVVIATYGDESWVDLAEDYAYPSVCAQTDQPDELVMIHDETLHDARNLGASECSSDHLIFLDADDELDSGYVAAMRAGSGDIRQPSTLGVVDGVEDEFPVLIPQTNLLVTNFLVIGTMIRRSLFESINGFDDYPILEDWALFLKAWRAGGVITACPDAIYRIHFSALSRNTRDPIMHGRYYSMIRQRYG